MQRRVPIARIDSHEALLSLAIGALPRRVEFSASLLLSEQGEHVQEELNRELGACGCGHAAVALILGLIALTALAVQIPMGNWWIRSISVLLGASAVMSVVKLTIVYRAHRRARRMTRQLIDRLAARSG